MTGRSFLFSLFFLGSLNLSAMTTDSLRFYHSPQLGIILSNTPILTGVFDDEGITMRDQRNDHYSITVSYGLSAGYNFSWKRIQTNMSLDFITGHEKYKGSNDSVYKEVAFKTAIQSFSLNTLYSISISNKNSLNFGLGISFDHKRFLKGSVYKWNNFTGNESMDDYSYNYFKSFSLSPFKQKIFVSPDVYFGFDTEVLRIPFSIFYRVKFYGARAISSISNIQTSPTFHQVLLVFKFKKRGHEK